METKIIEKDADLNSVRGCQLIVKLLPYGNGLRPCVQRP